MSDDQIDGNPNVCFGVADEQLDALIAYATVMPDLTTSFSCPSFRCAADASGCLQLPWEAQVDRSEAGNSRHGGVCLRRYRFTAQITTRMVQAIRAAPTASSAQAMAPP